MILIITGQIRHKTQVNEDGHLNFNPIHKLFLKEVELSAIKNETSNWDDFSPHILELNSWTGKF